MAKKKERQRIYLKIAEGFRRKGLKPYKISEMARDVFGHNSKPLRGLVMSHFYKARKYHEENFGGVIVPLYGVVTNGRGPQKMVVAYKVADPDAPEDVDSAKTEILRRGIVSQANAKRFVRAVENARAGKLIAPSDLKRIQGTVA